MNCKLCSATMLALLTMIGCSDKDDVAGNPAAFTDFYDADDYVPKHSSVDGYVDTDKWELSWNDEFDVYHEKPDRTTGEITGLDVDKWKADNNAYDAPNYICSRYPKNVSVDEKNGVLRLEIQREQNGIHDWSAGSIESRERFGYGYYECRYKYADVTTANNSFWIYNRNNIEYGSELEIDINEGSYPNMINLNIHNWSVDSNHEQYTDTTHHSYGDAKEQIAEFSSPVTCSQLRISSTHHQSVQVKEIRAIAADGKTNYMLDDGVAFTCSGVVNDDDEAYGAANVADGNEGKGWWTQKEGEKWLVADFGSDRTISSFELVSGYSYDSEYCNWIYPISNYTVEYLSGDKWIPITSWDVRKEYDFTKEFHTLGLDWSAEQLIFYFDGKEVRREPNKFCYDPSNVLLSLAMLEMHGTPSESDDGEAMVVDYVRYYTRK